MAAGPRSKRFLKRAVQVWLGADHRGGAAGAVLVAAVRAAHEPHRRSGSSIRAGSSSIRLADLATVGLMWMQPNLMDVLALYVLLIATAPVTVPFLLRYPLAALTASSPADLVLCRAAECPGAKPTAGAGAVVQSLWLAASVLCRRGDGGVSQPRSCRSCCAGAG